MSWFRVHTKLLHNSKVQTLEPHLFKALINIWCLSKEGNGVIPRDAEIGFQLRLTVSEARETVKALVNVGLLEQSEDGTYRAHEWEEHQFKSDVSTDRVKRFRNGKRNGDETFLKRPQGQSTESETESETEAESEQSQTPAASRPPAPTPIRPTAIRPAAPDAEQRIRALAEQQPDLQDFEIGVNRAVQEIADSANPETTLRTLEENLPMWWAAMRDGRAKPKKLRYVISDGDYLRRPREPSIPKSRKSAFDEPYREATT